jgi:hypothetical protein
MFGRNTKKNWGPFHGTIVGAGSPNASKLLVKILKQVNAFTPLLPFCSIVGIINPPLWTLRKMLHTNKIKA